MNLETLKKNREIIILTFFLAIFSLIYFGIQGSKVKQQLEANIKEEISYDADLAQIEAKSFYVYDIYSDKPIFSKDEHDKLPLASITKLMTGLIVFDILPDNAIITISKNDVVQEGDTGLVVGEKWKLKNLLNFSLITSSNDGIHAMEEALNLYEEHNNKNTIDLMNNMAKWLELADTLFINGTGVDVDSFVSGAYSSSYDTARLLSYIFKNNQSLIYDTKNQSETFISEDHIIHKASNTNLLINNIPGILASKTGFTDLAGGNLAVIFDAGFMHPVVAVLLGSTAQGRFTDMEKLVNLALRKLSNLN